MREGKKMQALSDLGIFMLYVIHHASAYRPLTRDRLIGFMCEVNELNAFRRDGMVVSEDAIDALLKECIRNAYIYPIQRRGEGGSFEQHFLLSPFGLEALVAGVQERIRTPEKRGEMECGYRHANKIFGLSRNSRNRRRA